MPSALRFQGQLDEYIHVPSPNERIALAFRSISTQGKIAESALTYAQRTRMNYLSEVANTPKHRFIDPINERYAISPLHDRCHFKDVIDILEPMVLGNGPSVPRKCC